MELKRLKEEQDIAFSKAYNILSQAGFELYVEDGALSVWYKGATIEIDIEEGMVVVPNEYKDEYEKRQEYLAEQF